MVVYYIEPRLEHTHTGAPCFADEAVHAYDCVIVEVFENFFRGYTQLQGESPHLLFLLASVRID